MKSLKALTALAGCLMCLCILMSFSPWPTHRGIDISHHNRDIDWESLRGMEFCYVKASEGARFQDPKCADYSRKARELGMEVGIYHYFRPEVDGRKQFMNFLSAADKSTWTLTPAVDVERTDTAGTARENLATFIELCRQQWGRKPIVYIRTPEMLTRFPAIAECRIWAGCIDSTFDVNAAIVQRKLIKNRGRDMDYNECEDLQSVILRK